MGCSTSARPPRRSRPTTRPRLRTRRRMRRARVVRRGHLDRRAVARGGVADPGHRRPSLRLLRARPVDRAQLRGAGDVEHHRASLADAGGGPRTTWSILSTGRSADSLWRTVSVVPRRCLDANIASTATIIRGERRSPWLESLGLPSRLVRRRNRRPRGRVAVQGGRPAARRVRSGRAEPPGATGPMSPAVASTLGPSAYWYLARGTGAVALVLLTVCVVLGILGSVRFVSDALAAIRDRRGPPRHLAAGDGADRRSTSSRPCSTGSRRSTCSTR